MREKYEKNEKNEKNIKDRRKAEAAGFNSTARPRKEKQQHVGRFSRDEKSERPDGRHKSDRTQRFEKPQRFENTRESGKTLEFEKNRETGRAPKFEKKREPGKMPRFEKTDKLERAKKPERMSYHEPEEIEADETGSDKLEGRNSVLEALKSDRAINKIMIAKGPLEGSIRQIASIAREKGIVVQEVERIALNKISSTNAHQGVIAFASIKEYVDVDDILDVARQRGEPPFIVILDGITDPHNLGAIIRTADAAGVHGIIIPKRRAIGLTPVVSKASAGAIEYVPVARVPNISQTIEYLKSKNVWVVGTDSTGDRAYYQGDLKGAIALVVGSEGEGMGKLVREKCDFVVNIPMKGQISSLNASVAAAIVIFEIYKQRGQ